jgi:hypothetical protein
MKSFSKVLIGCIGCAAAFSQTLPPTIRVTDETVPAGGLAQMKVLLTSPKPIMSGDMAMDMSAVMFDSINGIALFSNTGDVVGAATVNGGKVNVRFTSPNQTFGTNADYPLLTIALTVSKNAIAGQKYPVILDPTASLWQDLLGSPIAFEFKQGSITVGGSVSITNVVPGGGILPAGATFTIFGTGFTPSTKVAIRGLSIDSIQYQNSTQIRVKLKQPGMLDGTMIQVTNPDASSDTYYSYLRGVPVGQSTRALLNHTVPVFSILTATLATLTPAASTDASSFTAIAVQNPALVSSDVTIEAHAAGGALVAGTTVKLASGSRITREIFELFGTNVPAGGYLRIASSQPVQMLGLNGNDATGIVLPQTVTVLAAPGVVAPVDGVTNGGGGTGGGGSTGGGSGSGKPV